ncbi:omega-amidase, chloroplastic-like isoform X2 [Phoenix dactylifera]|uniref:Omega-amidase, chloroplastic-like isoform X2 n=1 Tax=Phoenix dactylifera TaxID=42345 RepID=A0A8B9AHT4_PHODC|nr:omega-amidase, chloroplastic-like isoform X2 [Phoenix dactylifera]
MVSNARIPPPIPPPQPKIPKFKIALCQLLVTPDKERNIAHARKSIEDAARKGAKLVVLPNLSKYAEDIDAEAACPSISMLSEVALCNAITIVGGSIPELAAGQLFNTCCVFGPDGKLKAKHRKLHLFDFDIPGEVTFRESDFLTAGEEPTIVDTDVGRIGIGVCHDIRFPELAMLYGSRGAHLICYPGAFNMSTGELLWELMQRARAADNQLFVATCAPAQDPNTSADYITWGHSGLVGPFGEIIATAGNEETTVIAEIDYSLIQFQREYLPLEVQRQGDMYKMVDVLGGNAQ